jgi:IS30 family transposase
MTSYKRVTAQDRVHIALLSKMVLDQTKAAAKLGFHKSTVGRELKRNRGGRGYRPKQAQGLALERQAWRAEPRKMTPALKGTLQKLLRRQWSPLQISKRLELEGKVQSATRRFIASFMSTPEVAAISFKIYVSRTVAEDRDFRELQAIVGVKFRELSPLQNVGQEPITEAVLATGRLIR